MQRVKLSSKVNDLEDSSFSSSSPLRFNERGNNFESSSTMKRKRNKTRRPDGSIPVNLPASLLPFSSTTVYTYIHTYIYIHTRVRRPRNWVTERFYSYPDDARRKCNRRRCGRDAACNHHHHHHHEQKQKQQLFGCRQVKRKGSSKGTWPIFVPWHFSTALKNFFFPPFFLPLLAPRNEPMVIKASKERDECTARKQCSPLPPPPLPPLPAPQSFSTNPPPLSLFSRPTRSPARKRSRFKKNSPTGIGIFQCSPVFLFLFTQLHFQHGRVCSDSSATTRNINASLDFSRRLRAREKIRYICSRFHDARRCFGEKLAPSFLLFNCHELHTGQTVSKRTPLPSFETFDRFEIVLPSFDYTTFLPRCYTTKRKIDTLRTVLYFS